MGLKCFFCLVGTHCLIGKWFVEDQKETFKLKKEKEKQKHFFKRYWTTSKNIINYYILDSEHKWKDLYV